MRIRRKLYICTGVRFENAVSQMDTKNQPKFLLPPLRFFKKCENFDSFIKNTRETIIPGEICRPQKYASFPRSHHLAGPPSQGPTDARAQSPPPPSASHAAPSQARPSLRNGPRISAIKIFIWVCYIVTITSSVNTFGECFHSFC